jgi:cytochrome b561
MKQVSRRHPLLAAILAALIVLRPLAALYRQFVLRDGLIGRMSFGRLD